MDRQNSPYFSVIIPTYNRSVELTTAITKILDQQFSNFELIVVDDGSTDDTQERVSGLKNEKIKYFKTENRERSHARNFGLQQARGLYVNYFDSDDIMYPDRLQKVFDWIGKNNSPDVLFTHYDFVDDRGNVIGQTERFYKSFTKDILFNNFLATGAVFLKREIAQRYPFHDDRKIITAEDWELWLRVHTQYDFQEFPSKTFAIVQHPGRSLHTISVDRIRDRELYFIELIRGNQEFKRKYGYALKLFIADRYTFLALTLAEKQQNIESVKYWLIAFASSIRVVGRRRFWGIIKTLIWRREKRS